MFLKLFGLRSADELPDPAQWDPSPEEAAGLRERLLRAAEEPHNWLMYSGTLDSQRFSRLEQVRRENVSELELKWAYQIPEIDRAETVPLVVDGVMFITESPSNVVAVDAGTGRPYWRYEHELETRIAVVRHTALDVQPALERIGPSFDFGAEVVLDSARIGMVSAGGEGSSQVVRHQEEVDCPCPPA